MIRTTSAVVRPATPADVEAVVAVHAASREAAYRGLLPDDLVVPDPDRSRKRWTAAIESHPDPARQVLVGTVADEVMGVAATEVPDGAGEPLELNALYVTPGRWGLGTGALLCERVLALAAASGYGHVVAWVVAKNEQAKRFYFARGWWLDGGVEVRERTGAKIVTQRFRHIAEPGPGS